MAAGRLKASVDADGQILDAALADSEWARNTDWSEAPAAIREREAARIAPVLDVVEVLNPPIGGDAPPAPALGGTLAENNAVKAYWQARQAELDYREAAGELVPAAEVRGKLEDVFHSCRTKLLGVPARARQRLPHLSAADIGEFEELVREALEALAAEGVA